MSDAPGTHGVVRARDVVVVAGGAGTRLWPLTDGVPKPLVEFCGEPFLVGNLRRFAAAGVERVWLVVGPDPAPFTAALEPVARSLGLTLRTVPEDTPLDTAGGVRSVATALRGPAIVCNGDILTDLDLVALVDHHVAGRATATLALTRVEDPSSFGVCVLDDGRITAFVEKPAPGTMPGQDTVNAGTYVLEPEALLRFDEGRLSFERAVFPGLVADGEPVLGFVWEGAWADLGTPDRYRDGHRMALEGLLRWPSVDAVLDRGGGVRVAAGASVAPTTELVGPVLVLDGAVIEDVATVGPDVVVGRGARVGAGTRLRDCVLGAGTHVDDDVRASGLVTGAGATVAAGTEVDGDTVVGPGATLGPGRGTVSAGAVRPAVAVSGTRVAATG